MAPAKEKSKILQLFDTNALCDGGDGGECSLDGEPFWNVVKERRRNEEWPIPAESRLRMTKSTKQTFSLVNSIYRFSGDVEETVSVV